MKWCKWWLITEKRHTVLIISLNKTSISLTWLTTMQLSTPGYEHLHIQLFGQVLHPMPTQIARVRGWVGLSGMKMTNQPMVTSEKRHFTFLLCVRLPFHPCIWTNTRLQIEFCGLFERYPNSYHSFLRYSKVRPCHQYFYEVKSLILWTKRQQKWNCSPQIQNEDKHYLEKKQKTKQ